MADRALVAAFLLCCIFTSGCRCDGMIEGLYCGEENCYDLLGITRDVSRGDLSKAYRQLAKKWHPDMHKTQKDKEEAAIMFRKIATAYETLKDDESRKDYDYMLDHPEEYYSHYYRYYRRRVAPKVDVRIVIVVTITIISVVQYLGAWNNYRTALAYLVTVPKYRMQAKEIAKKEGLFDSDRKRDRTKTKEELKEEEENILKNILAQKVDIRGGYRKPSILDILWLQLLFSPYYIAQYIIWYFTWIWKYTICRREYTDIDKQYLIRKYLGIKEQQWEALEDKDKDEMLKKELWVKEKFVRWKAEKEETQREELAENSKHKKYRRYLKKGGPGQMTFGPD